MIAFSCRHDPVCTGRRIQAEFGKRNLVEPAIRTTGEEAICSRCGQRLIVHEPRLGFACAFSELEDVA